MPTQTEIEDEINFELQQATLMADFTNVVEEIGHQVKTERKARNLKMEAEEQAGVEDILEDLFE